MTGITDRHDFSSSRRVFEAEEVFDTNPLPAEGVKSFV
jgi:hypothetical protein